MYFIYAWHGGQQITTPVILPVRDAARREYEAEYIDGSVATLGRAQYRIAGAVYQLRRDGVLETVQQKRKAA